MARKRLERREWLRLARAWKRSGLPCKEFAKTEGVNAATLSWWSWKLRAAGENVPKSGVAAPGRTSCKRSRPTRNEPTLSFVELEAESVVGSREEGRLELEAAGVVVRVGEGFNGPLLASVLDVLETRR